MSGRVGGHVASIELSRITQPDAPYDLEVPTKVCGLPHAKFLAVGGGQP